MRTYENIEKIFKDEIREKKKIGNGAFHMRGKGVKHGFSGALRTPYHFMKTKEKKKLDGEVSVFNMYETILPKDEFLLKDKETQKLMLTRWREIYDNTLIKKEMGISNKPYYDLCSALEIPKKRVMQPPRKNRGAKINKPSLIETVEQMALEVPEKEKPEIKPIIITKGLHLEYNGEYNSEDLNKVFTKLQLLIDGEKNNFNVSISLTEKA